MNAELGRRLLDTSAMHGVLSEMPALRTIESKSIRLSSFWVKPGRYFNSHYRIRLANGRDSSESRVSAFMLNPKALAKVRKRLAPHTCDGKVSETCTGCSSYVYGTELLLQVFPVDYRLPTLRSCLDKELIRAALPCDFRIVDVEPAAYRPGKRCQVLYRSDEGQRLYGKVSVETDGAGSGFVTLEALHEALAGSSAVGVPTPRSFVDSLQLTLVDGESGTTLHDLIRDRQCSGATVEKVALAIGAFHNLGPERSTRYFGVADELDLLAGWVETAAELYPEFADGLIACRGHIEEIAPAKRAPAAMLHRDLFDKQVLVGEGPPILLDNDTVSAGDAELDIGNFCAHLRLRALQWGQPRELESVEEQFLASYPRDLEAERLSWYRAATLLRLACGYALRARWRHLVPRLLEQAGQASQP